MAVNLFEFVDVRLRLGTTDVLDGLDMTIADHGITALVGPSGSGKSTALRCCNRLEVPSSGTITFRGTDLATVEPRALRRRVGMVFQRPTPFDGSVFDNLKVAVADLDENRAAEVLSRVGLDLALLHREASTLSGGEQQRACLARTLVTDPEALLMDEPTSALDPDATHLLEHLAQRLAADGVPVVWVSHDPEQVARIADHVIRIERGRAVSASSQEPGHRLDEDDR